MSKRNQLSRGDIIRLLNVNDLVYTKTAPSNPVVERTQKKSFAEGGGGTIYGQGQHVIVNLQSGTEFIDPLQSVLVFDLTIGVAAALKLSATALFRDVVVQTRTGKEMDRHNHANQHNYTRVVNGKPTMVNGVYNGMFGVSTPDATASRNIGLVDTHRISIPLKFLAGIFDSKKLMPPHLARGLKVDCLLEASRLALQDAAVGTATYSITNVAILSDNYRMADSVLAFLNQEFASKDTGLVYEYASFVTAQTTVTTTSLSIEVARAVSMALDAQLVTTLTPDNDFKVEGIVDSFASIAMDQKDDTQWRIGSHYLPNTSITGRAEHFTQYIYWLNSLRSEDAAGVQYKEFIATAGQFCMTLQRNAILDQSGMALNNSSTLQINGTLGAVPDPRLAYVFLRHLRRAVCFLESVQLET